MKILTKDLKDSIYLKEMDGVFITLEVDGIGVGVYGTPSELTEENLVNEFKKLNLVLDFNTLAKVIGSRVELLEIDSLLKRFKEVKKVERNHGFELYFLPLENRLRLAKEVVKEKTKVLIIDDSTTICKLLERIISSHPDLDVIGTINNPLEAEAFILKNKPDVITLDIHMPEMNGVELIKDLHPKFKIPTVMISSISMEEGPLVMEALENGAVDYLQKPDMTNIDLVSLEINNKIIQASLVKQTAQVAHRTHSKISQSFNTLDDKLIVIGSSTGGTKALYEILTSLPSEIPPILIVQHIPEVFSRAFANRLNDQCPFEVKEAVEGDIVEPGVVIIAQGGKHMAVKKIGNDYKVIITEDEPVNRFRPSVDYLFNSVSKVVTDKKILSLILTGMGRDGADGTKILKENNNAITMAQDEASSVVFGMPKEAIKTGKVDHVVSLDDIPQKLISVYK